jgi:hypothetical protein
MARTPEAVTVDPDLSSRGDMKRALQMAHFTVTGEAGYGIEAVTVAQEKLPDVFLAIRVAFQRVGQQPGRG